MTDTARLQRCVEDARRMLERAEADLHAHRARRRVRCMACDKSHAIKDLTLIVVHHYVEPHGCTEGDYWSPGEWRFACPVDGQHNRILFHDWDVPYQDREKIGVAAKPTFERTYDRCFARRENLKVRPAPYGLINDYIDTHRERFELPVRPVRRTASYPVPAPADDDD